MRLGVISDTHGHIANTRRAAEQLRQATVDTILHCGDIGSPEVVALLSAWPAHFVFGNVDRDREPLRRAIKSAGQFCHGLCGALELAGRRIALLHGDDARSFVEVVDSGQYDLVCYGHTHRQDWSNCNGVWLLNPGAVFRARPHSVAVVELPELEARFISF